MIRPSNRKNDELRSVSIETNVSSQAEGSCFIFMGNTRVFCTASISEDTPRWLKGTGKGWVTAEYGMLPRSTNERMNREAKKGQSGRTQEIQRLIARSLRAAVNLEKLGERQIIVDCDVIQADGGTRCASITGGFVALYEAIKTLNLPQNPIEDFISAVSCGIYKGQPVLDLDYPEDSNAEADGNFILNESGDVVEIQATAEDKPFPHAQFNELYTLADKGIKELIEAQKQALQIA